MLMLTSLVCINVGRLFSPLGFANYNFVPIRLLPHPGVLTLAVFKAIY
jgi:hypothetical protein